MYDLDGRGQIYLQTMIDQSHTAKPVRRRHSVLLPSATLLARPLSTVRSLFVDTLSVFLPSCSCSPLGNLLEDTLSEQPADVFLLDEAALVWLEPHVRQ